MNGITISAFQQAVARYFEPIARRYGLPLIQTADHIYEIPSEHFVLRIRFEIGAHNKSVNATLIPRKQVLGEIGQGTCAELGVRVIAGFNGMPIEYIPRDQTEEGLLAEAQYVAKITEQFGIPYLLGQKSDWDQVQEFVRKRIEKSSEKIKKYKFPPSVQKRWHLPPSNKVEPNNE